jgi:hypothetical protein
MISVGYLLARRLLGCLMVLARREVSKDAELLARAPGGFGLHGTLDRYGGTSGAGRIPSR